MSDFGIWTDEKVEALRKHRAEGYSFGEISKRIKMSRNACIGKAERLGLPKLTAPGGRKKPPKQKILPHNLVDQHDPEHVVDTRDLAILDAMMEGRTPHAVARQHRVPESYVRELWRVRELQESVGEGA